MCNEAATKCRPCNACTKRSNSTFELNAILVSELCLVICCCCVRTAVLEHQNYSQTSFSTALLAHQPPHMLPGNKSPPVADLRMLCVVTAHACRLPEVLRAKTTDIGVVPSTAVVMDTNGLPAFVAFDWARPQHMGTLPPTQPVPVTASQVSIVVAFRVFIDRWTLVCQCGGAMTLSGRWGVQDRWFALLGYTLVMLWAEQAVISALVCSATLVVSLLAWCCQLSDPRTICVVLLSKRHQLCMSHAGPA